MLCKKIYLLFHWNVLLIALTIMFTQYVLVFYIKEPLTMTTVTDCSEVYRMGLKLPGYYNIDPTGDMDPKRGVPAYCEDGWTYILRRHSERDRKVIFIFNNYPQILSISTTSIILFKFFSIYVLGKLCQKLDGLQRRLSHSW